MSGLYPSAKATPKIFFQIDKPVFDILPLNWIIFASGNFVNEPQIRRKHPKHLDRFMKLKQPKNFLNERK